MNWPAVAIYGASALFMSCVAVIIVVWWVV